MKCVMRVLCLLLLASLATAQSFPCDNCRMLVPDSYDGEPTPLLVALHGDEGTSEHIYTAYRRHVEASGWLMVSLECPRDLGCWSGSWYEWENTGGHDWDWLGRQVDAVAAEYNVDPNAVHLTGWSGGAQYLGRYAVRFAERYAGVAYIGGGVPSRRAECPACEIPAYFLIGSRDFLLDSARRMESFLEGCGHEIEFDIRAGRPHGDIWEMVNEGGGQLILDWFEARPNVCLEPPGDDPEASVGDEPWVRRPEEEPEPEPEPESEPETEPPSQPGPPILVPDAGPESTPQAGDASAGDGWVLERNKPIEETAPDEARGCGAVPGAPWWALLLLATPLPRRRRSRRRS